MSDFGAYRGTRKILDMWRGTGRIYECDGKLYLDNRFITEMFQGHIRIYPNPQVWSDDVLPGISTGKYPIDVAGWKGAITDVHSYNGFIEESTMGWQGALNHIHTENSFLEESTMGWTAGLTELTITES